MKPNCERCGHVFGFFERPRDYENARLGISWQSLCPSCLKEIKQTAAQTEQICFAVNDAAQKITDRKNAAGDAGLLVFLAAAELFHSNPDFADPKNALVRLLGIDDDPAVIRKSDYFIRMLYRVLREGFIGALGKIGIDSFDAFSAYMHKYTLLCEQVRCTLPSGSGLGYADVFICPEGLVFLFDKDKQVKKIYVGSHKPIRFTELHEGATYHVTFTDLRYPGTRSMPVLCFDRPEDAQEAAELLARENTHKEETTERDTKALIEKTDVQIVKDLRALRPEDELSHMPVDAVLVCAVKNLFDHDEEEERLPESEDGLLGEILSRRYAQNLANSGYNSPEQLQAHIRDDCVLAAEFTAAIGKYAPEPAWGFFAPGAYMIRFIKSGRVLAAAADGAPNDLYANHQFMIFEGSRQLYLQTGEPQKKEDGSYVLQGVRINAAPGALEQFGQYFDTQSLAYIQNVLAAARTALTDETKAEIRSAAGQLFISFGNLPFVTPMEWESIERGLAENDLYLKTVLPARVASAEKPAYAGRIVHEFTRAAETLAQDLSLDSVSAAKALLWEELVAQTRSAASDEWQRLAGDVVDQAANADEAVQLYALLPGLETERAYIFGLFVQHLLSKKIIPEQDFADANRALLKSFKQVKPEAFVQKNKTAHGDKQTQPTEPLPQGEPAAQPNLSEDEAPNTPDTQLAEATLASVPSTPQADSREANHALHPSQKPQSDTKLESETVRQSETTVPQPPVKGESFLTFETEEDARPAEPGSVYADESEFSGESDGQTL